MRTEDTQPDWLVLAEKELADELAEKESADEDWAAEIAKTINDGLAELGITPIEPAKADGHGKLIPAKLTRPDPRAKLYGVYASYDEEINGLSILVTTQASYDHNVGLKEWRKPLHGCTPVQARRLIVMARREGPPPAPPVRERPSADTQALVIALDEVRAAIDGVARNVGRP